MTMNDSIDRCDVCGHAADDHDRRGEGNGACAECPNRLCADKAFTPGLARRVLRSWRENGDTLPDVDRLACEMALTGFQTTTRGEARRVLTEYGLAPDQEGWLR